MAALYEIPEEFYFRLHHSRPRFKSDVESVMLFMAGEITRMSPSENDVFKQALNSAIRLYPGNGSATDKTINNWRTEISSLFGLIARDGSLRKPSDMAYLLAENQDLIEFFRYFLYYFQYPGGHLKAQEVVKMIDAGIKFKPAKYLIEVILEGQKLVDGGKFGLTKAEATHCIFNDLRITRDGQSPRTTATQIIARRSVGTEYDSEGDVIRYAGDILDYMELADLVRQRPNYQYYLNMANIDVLQAFVSSDTEFTPYKAMYSNPKLTAQDVNETLETWFNYVNNKLDSSIFEANVLSIIEGMDEEATTPKQTEFIAEVLERIRAKRASEIGIKTKEIGDVGEAIVIEHEKIRLTNLSRQDLLHLVKKIPEQYGVGYDIGSYEGVGTSRRFVEVKTTVSRGKLHTSNFHMTPSEWSAADTLSQTYFIYRLAISTEDVSLFLIQDPVGKYKQSLIDMVPRDGVDVRYTEKSGVWEKLLV
jgi:hypothetical protein